MGSLCKVDSTTQLLQKNDVERSIMLPHGKKNQRRKMAKRSGLPTAIPQTNSTTSKMTLHVSNGYLFFSSVWRIKAPFNFRLRPWCYIVFWNPQISSLQVCTRVKNLSQCNVWDTQENRNHIHQRTLYYLTRNYSKNPIKLSYSRQAWQHARTNNAT